METLINKIVECEKQAQDIIKDSKLMKQNLENDIKKEIEEIKKKEFDYADKIIGEFKDKEAAKLKKALDEAEYNHKKQIDTLNKKFTDNKEKWINEIFNRIIKI